MNMNFQSIFVVKNYEIIWIIFDLLLIDLLWLVVNCKYWLQVYCLYKFECFSILHAMKRSQRKKWTENSKEKEKNVKEHKHTSDINFDIICIECMQSDHKKI